MVLFLWDVKYPIVLSDFKTPLLSREKEQAQNARSKVAPNDQTKAKHLKCSRALRYVVLGFYLHKICLKCKNSLCVLKSLQKSACLKMLRIQVKKLHILRPGCTLVFWHLYLYSFNSYLSNTLQMFTAVYREIEVQRFQIYGDCMYTRNPCNLKSPHSDFHCNIWREFDVQGYYGDTPH